MTVFQKYTVSTTICIICMFAAAYCLLTRQYVALFGIVAIGIVSGLVRTYYKDRRLTITEADKVAMETLSRLGKRK